MYLDPQDGKEPMFKAAVRLLHNHGESLDPLQVLEVSGSVSHAHLEAPFFIHLFSIPCLSLRILLYKTSEYLKTCNLAFCVWVGEACGMGKREREGRLIKGLFWNCFPVLKTCLTIC